MKGLFWALLAFGALTSSASAAEKPAFGPPPAWVRPVAAPEVSASAEETPARVLLADQQIAFEPGRVTTYTETIFRIETPQGLASGDISLQWRPDTDVLTVHRVLIRRGDQRIDVLGSGQTFTVLRREQNLESAMLDGVLSAYLQPEGLQVGDVLEIATSLSSSDPVMKGHVENFGAAWNVLPIARAHLRMQWPASLAMQVRGSGGLPAVKPVARGGGIVEAELALDNAQPLLAPKGAPLRYGIGRLVEATDFGSWSDLAALMAPLYEAAAVLPAQGPLRDEAERIKQLSADPKVRAAAALALVQDRIRYVALAMGEAGYVPADVETTWARRFGDCKGKTVLLLALLREMGIAAEPVLVSSAFGDGLDARLPMVGYFDHVPVRATVGGRVYWLDGTRTGDTSLDRLITPNFGWGLPVRAQGAALVPMRPEPLLSPHEEVSIRFDASAGIFAPAIATGEIILRGDGAVSSYAVLAMLATNEREQTLRELWKEYYGTIVVKSASMAFDRNSGELLLSMNGEYKLDWSNNIYQSRATRLGYIADFSRDPGSDTNAPFAVDYPLFETHRETIVLPKEAVEFELLNGGDIDVTAAGFQYRRRAAITDGVATIEKSARSIAPEFPASEAAGYQAALRKLSNQLVSIRVPLLYRSSAKDTVAIEASTPVTPSDHVLRANINARRGDGEAALSDLNAAVEADPKNALGYASRGEYFLGLGDNARALADFNQALALSPANPVLLAMRAHVHADEGDFAAAQADIAAAVKLHPRNPLVLSKRAYLAQKQRRLRQAVTDYTAALNIDPTFVNALSGRAETAMALGDYQTALRDAAAVLALMPDWTEMNLLRANIYKRQSQKDFVRKEADAAIAANPDDSYAHQVAAAIYTDLELTEQALAAFSKAIQLKPEAHLYLSRSDLRPQSDAAGRRADLEAALALEPGNASALLKLGYVQLDTQNYAEAVANFTAVLKSEPRNADALANRGIAYVWLDDFDRAGKDLDAAAEIEPEHPVIYRARGLRAIKQQDWREAIKAFTAALTIEPENAFALGLRALAASESGDDSAALRDAEAAIALEPDRLGLYDLRASIFADQLAIDLAMKEAAALAAAHPNSASANAIAGGIYSRVLRRQEAVASYDRAIELEPKAVLFIERGYARPAADVAGRRADIEAALKLEPDNLLAQRTIGNMQRDRKDYTGAIEIYSKILAVAEGDPDALIERGVTYALVGDLDKAEADFEAVSATDAAGEILTALCWTKASVRVVLESALSDCNAALKKTPGDSYYLINRGLALLQLGRYDAAIADYDKALRSIASVGHHVEALYGRALAWAGKGDAQKSARDAAAAKNIDPHVDEEFARFGLTLPTP